MKYLNGVTLILLAIVLVDNPDVAQITDEVGIQLDDVSGVIQTVFDSVQSMGFFG